MDLTPELLGTAAVGLIVIIGAIGTYLRNLRKPVADPVMAGIGGGFVDREQMERLIYQTQRIADALTDKNTAGINERLEDLAHSIDDLRDKPHPPRRRQ